MSEWTTAEDPGSGSTYYYNTVTGETRWDAPEGFESGAGQAAGEEGGSAADWVSAVDPGSQATYYYNSVTGETSWDKPAVVAEAEAAAAAASSPAADDTSGDASATATPSSPTKHLSAKEKLEKRKLSILKKRKDASSRSSKKDNMTLAEKLKARATRYARKRGKKTAKPRPPPRRPSAPAAAASGGGSGSGEGATAAAPAAAPAAAGGGALPEGWEEVTDPSSGSVYYYNAGSGESSWDRPTA